MILIFQSPFWHYNHPNDEYEPDYAELIYELTEFICVYFYFFRHIKLKIRHGLTVYFNLLPGFGIPFTLSARCVSMYQVFSDKCTGQLSAATTYCGWVYGIFGASHVVIGGIQQMLRSECGILDFYIRYSHDFLMIRIQFPSCFYGVFVIVKYLEPSHAYRLILSGRKAPDSFVGGKG